MTRTPGPELSAHRASLQYLDVDAGRMAYLDCGPRDAPTVLLVHGMPTSSWLYRSVAASLATRGVRAVAPDLIGFGASSKPAVGEVYSVPAQSRRIEALLDHLTIDAAVFACHDLGGPWVFELAGHSPGRVKGLAILNTSAYADLMTPPREARLVGGAMGPAMLAAMGSRIGRPMIRKFFADFTHSGRGLAADVTDGYWQSLHEGGTRAFRSFAVELDAAMGEFARYASTLRDLDVPATIIWGAEDPVLRHEALVPRFAEDLRVAADDMHVLDRASHFLQEDRPEDIADIIARFVHSRGL